MADQMQTKSKRDLMGERLKSKYPDREWPDDEAMFSQIGDDYDQYEKEIGGYRDRESKLTEMFTKDPRSAQFVVDMAKGEDPWTSLIGRIGIDGVKEILDDPEKAKEFEESNREYVEKLAESRQLEEEWQHNMEQTVATMEQKQASEGIDDEKIDAAWDWIRSVADDALRGIVRAETLDMALKAINHDADVAAADAEGEVRGRNAKAETMLRKPSEGDGVARLGGANNAPAPQAGKDSIFELAAGA